jgi:lysyl-tRNA synthetase class 2
MSANANWWKPEIFMAKRPYLEARAKMISAVRAYFDRQGFLEIETPILQVMPCADMHIHGFPTYLKGLDLKVEKELWLHTSPEFEMKMLLVAGLPKIYQICHVFRNGERSKRHSPEFTMIEWYRANAGYKEIMDDCIGLLRFCAEKLGIKKFKYAGKECDPFAEWEIISVADAFLKYAGIDLRSFMKETEAHRAAAESNDKKGFFAAAKGAGVPVREQDSWEEIFFAVMADKIEPKLGFASPAIIYDYPASMAALSRKNGEDPRFAKRFEMYVCGLELANAFDELTDAAEQRKRFADEMAAKQEMYGESYPPDEDFLAALEYGMPPSGGIALGVDRLAMVVSGAGDIDQVLWCGKP